MNPTKASFILALALGINSAASLANTAAEKKEKTPVYKTSLPPSADLSYAIRAKQSGLTLDGTAVVHWEQDGKKFSIHTETRTKLLGKLIDAQTQGTINANGLVPHSFTEKRISKPTSTTTFNWDEKKLVFSASDQSYPLSAGEQDRNSIVWQLVAVARANKAKFKEGSEWEFFVASQRDAEKWVFKVAKGEAIQTTTGPVDTIHVARIPPDERGQRLEIWLAPQQQWYPVRIRFTDDRDSIDQTLTSLAPAK